MIDDRTAQRIASEWHSGQTSALYALASSGAILHDPETFHNTTARAIASEIDIQNMEIGGETRDLHALLSYVYKHGPRGPVPGWYDRVIRAGE